MFLPTCRDIPVSQGEYRAFSQQPEELRDTFLKAQKRIRPKDKGSYSASFKALLTLPTCHVCFRMLLPQSPQHKCFRGWALNKVRLNFKSNQTIYKLFKYFINFSYKKKNPNFPWLYFGLGDELLESRGSIEIILDSAVTEKLHVELHYCTQKLTLTAKDLPLQTWASRIKTF